MRTGHRLSHPAQWSSEILQTRILEFLESRKAPTRLNEIHDNCGLSGVDVTVGLLSRLERLGLVVPETRPKALTKYRLSGEAEAALRAADALEVLAHSLSKGTYRWRPERRNLSQQEWFVCFKSGYLGLSAKEPSYGDLGKTPECRRFFDLFMSNPDLSHRPDVVIFNVEEIAKMLSTLILYLLQEARERGMQEESLAFLQPLHLAALYTGLPFAGVAYCTENAILGETKWYCFNPGIVPFSTIGDETRKVDVGRIPPDSVMVHFVAFLRKFTGIVQWQWFTRPWEIELALHSFPGDSAFYRLPKEECMPAIEEDAEG